MLLTNLKKHQFLFEELVKRDFKKKYKGTVLGMGWSVLSPLLTLLVMNIVFSHFFGRGMKHYTIYLFCGNLLFSYFRESTTNGMSSLLGNAAIFSKVNVPKYLFLLSKNVSTFINFLLVLLVFFMFCIADKVDFGLHFLMLLYPVACIVVFNIGLGFILSALYVFYRDMEYLYNIFTLLLMYMSAIFYRVDIMPAKYQDFFLLNPVYVYINYFREIVLNGNIPSIEYHLLCAFYAVVAMSIGVWMYKKNNYKFLYYI